MALPKAIQDQLDQVEKLEQEMSGEQAADSQTEPGVEAADTTTERQQDTDRSHAETERQPNDEVRKLHDRLRTIEGKYTAEVPRLSDALREREREMEKLQRQLDEANRRIEEANSIKTEDTVTDKDGDVFGADLVEMVQRVARSEFSKLSKAFLAAELDKRLTPLREQVGSVAQAQATSAEDGFWSELGRQVPDWESINAEQDWIEWLRQENQETGVVRQAVLDNAQKHLDIKRIVGLFNAYKKTKPGEQQSQPDRKRELSRQVAPPKSKAGTLPQGEKVWTQSEYLTAMDPRMSKEIGYDAWVRLQDEADRAFQEGRVR